MNNPYQERSSSRRVTLPAIMTLGLAVVLLMVRLGQEAQTTEALQGALRTREYALAEGLGAVEAQTGEVEDMREHLKNDVESFQLSAEMKERARVEAARKAASAEAKEASEMQADRLETVVAQEHRDAQAWGKKLAAERKAEAALVEAIAAIEAKKKQKAEAGGEEGGGLRGAGAAPGAAPGAALDAAPTAAAAPDAAPSSGGPAGDKPDCGGLALLRQLQGAFDAGGASMADAFKLAAKVNCSPVTTAVISSVTQICMLDNFLASIDALPTAPTTVISNLDKGGYDGCVRLSEHMTRATVVCARNFLRPNGLDFTGPKVSYGSKLWRKMVWTKPKLVQAGLKAGANIFFSDIDLVISRDPTSMFMAAPSHRMLVSCQHEQANIGSVFVRPERLPFINLWAKQKEHYSIDQDAFRILLGQTGDENGTGPNGKEDCRCLPHSQFGFLGEDAYKSTPELVSYHFILSKDKPAAMEELGLWKPRLFTKADCGFVAGARSHKDDR